MQLALREALRFGHNYVGTEHILLGLLRDEKSAGARVLTGLGVTRHESQQWVLAALEGYRRARAES
jgi:ATP-dependent Clp protease ATP-binding subunit ClpA